MGILACRWSAPQRYNSPILLCSRRIHLGNFRAFSRVAASSPLAGCDQSESCGRSLPILCSSFGRLTMPIAPCDRSEHHSHSLDGFVATQALMHIAQLPCWPASLSLHQIPTKSNQHNQLESVISSLMKSSVCSCSVNRRICCGPSFNTNSSSLVSPNSDLPSIGSTD